VKKVLVVTSTFPPRTSPGAFRGESLFKYLSEYGFETYVLTSTEKNNSSNNEDRIFRIPYPDLKIFRLLRASGRLLPVDGNILWYFYTKKIFGKLKKIDIDVIISTSPSNITHLIASDLSDHLDCKWIAEFRDLWFGSPYSWYLLPFFKNIESNIEKSILSNANVLTAVNSEWIDTLEKRYPDKKKALIRIGYDESKLKDIKFKKPSGTFTISYTGSFYFNSPNIERSPYPFLKAVKKIHKDNLIPENELNINFIGLEGSQKQIVLGMIDDLNIPSKVVNITGRVSHEKALELTSKSDINLLIEESNSLPRKIYDYLIVKRPILALVYPSSPVRDIVNKTKSGYCVSQGKTNKIVNFILERYHNRYSYDQFEFDIDEFSEQKQIRKYANLIEEILE